MRIPARIYTSPSNQTPGLALACLVSVCQFGPATAAIADTSQKRQCEVINGVVVCKSQADQYSGLSPQEKGRQIYTKLDESQGPVMGYGGAGYGDSQARFVAKTTNADGVSHRREVRLMYLENAPEGNKRLVIFEKPNDLKRHALLTISRKQGLDEQWAYDPETKQVKRILSNNAATPFSGLDIAFEDLSSQDVDKYYYEYARLDQHQGREHHVVNRFPKDSYSGYSRMETWVDVQTQRVSKVEYYDENNQHMKTLSLSDYQQYDNKYWRANRMFMANHQSGSRTELTWTDQRFNTGLSAEDFSLNSLRNLN